MAEKIRINLEYPVNTSPKILYYRLFNPSGLEEWFADKVSVQGKKYNFKWAQSEQNAVLVEKKVNNFVKYRWEDSKDEHFFELKIDKQEVTGDVALCIIDFAIPDEVEEVTEMWDEQIANLKYCLGV